jgi:cytoskeletal protein RodZ
VIYILNFMLEDTVQNTEKVPDSMETLSISHQIGIKLKQLREEKNMTLEEISQLSKIRKLYLEAIEGGNDNIIPQGAYTMGYIKIYSQILNYDIQSFLALMKEPVNENIQSPSNTQIAEYSSLPTKTILITCIVVIIFTVFFL